MLDKKSIANDIVAAIIMIPVGAGLLWTWNRYVSPLSPAVTESKIWKYFTGSILFPVWLTWALIAASLLAVVCLLAKVLKKPRPQQPEKSESVTDSKTSQKETTVELKISSYFEDNIFGINWNWSRGLFEDKKLTPYCPVCQTRLEMEGPGGSLFWGPTEFYCEHCDKIIKTTPDSPGDVHRKVWKEIERRKRTGEWKKAIKQQEV